MTSQKRLRSTKIAGAALATILATPSVAFAGPSGAPGICPPGAAARPIILAQNTSLPKPSQAPAQSVHEVAREVASLLQSCSYDGSPLQLDQTKLGYARAGDAQAAVGSIMRYVGLPQNFEIVEGPVGPGMVSEWEVSVLGLKCKVRSVLEQAEPFGFLRWSYDGPVRGWGECEISALGDGATATFTTELRPKDPALNKLVGIAAASGAATTHLKRCLAHLGQTVSESGEVRVVSDQPSAASRQLLPR